MSRKQKNDAKTPTSKPTRKASLHLVQYNRNRIGARSTDPRFGMWAFVLRDQSSPRAIIFSPEASAYTELGDIGRPLKYKYRMVETNTTLAKSTIFNERGDFEREIIDPSTLAVAFHLCPVRSIRLMEFEADERLLLLVYSVLEITFVASIHVSTEPDWAVSQRWVVLALLELAAE